MCRALKRLVLDLERAIVVTNPKLDIETAPPHMCIGKCPLISCAMGENE